MSRESDLRSFFIDALKKKKRPLKKQIIDGLVEEKLEIDACVNREKLHTIQYPTKEDIKWWFQDPPSDDQKEVEPGVFEQMYEVDVDSICLEDKLAHLVYTKYYDWFWTQGKEIPKEIEDIIDVQCRTNGLAHKMETKSAKARIANIAMVGVIRYYHKERSPYFCPTEISKSVEFIRQALGFLNNVRNGKFDEKVIKGELYIFGPLVANKEDVHGEL